MLKWIEATGKNEDAAIKNALEQLGLDRDSVSVEVLERAKSGFFGIGGNPAKVKVTYEVPDEAPPAEEPAPQAAPAPQPEPAPKRERRAPRGNRPTEQEAQVAHPVEDPVPAEEPAPAEPAAPAPAPEAAQPAAAIQELPMEGAELEQRIRDFLTGLLEHMGVSAQVKVQTQGERGVQVIGHRGDTLDAIQQLTNYAVNRGRSHRVRIHVDAENYRARREESLQRLATKVAGKVVKYRRNITLEPMNAYERHVIHETLQDYPDIITYSTGAEPNRRTVIAFSRGKHSY